MRVNANQYDVFLSYSMADADRANTIISTFEASGMRVFDPRRFSAGEGMDEAIKLAIAESGAMVAIVEPRPWISPHILTEVGAAWGWNKPVYVLSTSLDAARESLGVSGTTVYHMSRIDDVVGEIRKHLRPLSQQDREALLRIYQDMRIATDRLALEPSSVEELAQRFRRRQRKTVSGERLVRELIRMRKQGKLPRLRQRVRSSA